MSGPPAGPCDLRHLSPVQVGAALAPNVPPDNYPSWDWNYPRLGLEPASAPARGAHSQISLALSELGRTARTGNPAASVARPRSAEAKAVFQGEGARLAGQWRVVVVVTVAVAVAVAGHSGRAERGDALDAVG